MDIFDEILQAESDAADWLSRMEEARRIRECVWDGQSLDGRKHREDMGVEPFPWEGASDARVRTVDEVVQEQVMLMMQSFVRARISAKGTEAGDLAWGQKVGTLLKYILWTRMAGQLRRELGLAANWRQWFGASVTCVMWDQQLRKMEQEVTVEGLAALMLAPEEIQNAEMVAGAVDAAAQLVLDPSREEQALRMLEGLSSILGRRGARRALDELRANGRTMIDVPEVFAAEPRLTALLPMVDIFFPAVTDDLQRAPWVAHREKLGEDELRDRINTHGYDEAWVEQAVKMKGSARQSGRSFLTSWYGTGNPERDLIEIYHVYSREVDETGIPSVRMRVMCDAIRDADGLDVPMPYLHGNYPYVVHQREHIRRPIIDSRGVAELGGSWQHEQKVQRDSRTDRTSVTTLPPLIVPARRGGQRLRLGPGAQLPAAGRNENYEWMRTPPYDAGSIEIEKATERSIGRYFGRIDEQVPQQLTVLHQADLVDGWLIELRMVCAQVLQLCQQYMSEEEVVRIVGKLERPWTAGQREIQGMYDLSVEADPRDLNIETLKEKWGFIEILLKYDRAGRVDYSQLVEFGLGAIDPNMAERLLIPMDAANAKQVAEEQDVIAKAMAGIEVPMEPQPGMNYQLRAQVLQESIARNPELQKRIAAQPDSQALIENRMKFLQFQVQQIENAAIGRVGAEPVMGGQ